MPRKVLAFEASREAKTLVHTNVAVPQMAIRAFCADFLLLFRLKLLSIESQSPSFSSTLASSLLDYPGEENIEDQMVFPYMMRSVLSLQFLEPPERLQATGTYVVPLALPRTSLYIAIPESEPIEHAEDDFAAQPLPSRHVDYLSHNWKE
jgi:hypothetical protein